MKNLMDFAGGFGDFATMFSDVDFDEYVIRFYYNDNPEKSGNIDGCAFYKVVIGYTLLDTGDVLLHLVDAEAADTWDEIYENAKRYGIEFQLLSNMIGDHGFEINPVDQVDWEDENDDCDCDCCCCCDTCDCEITELLEEEFEIEFSEELVKEFGKIMTGLSAAMLLNDIGFSRSMNPFRILQ